MLSTLTCVHSTLTSGITRPGMVVVIPVPMVLCDTVPGVTGDGVAPRLIPLAHLAGSHGYAGG